MKLDAHALSKLSGVRLRARAVVEGVLSGQHKSPHHGQSVEFAEHKEYAPGDELRHLDWKALARFDKFYVKRFEHETNLRANLVIDSSGSMGYGSGPLTKLDVARVLAGSLGHLLIRQQDSAGLTLLEGEKFRDIPARSSPTHLNAMLDTLDGVKPAGQTRLFDAADRLAERLPRRSLVLVFSDFFDEDDRALPRLLALRARKHDVAVFHLVDRAELTFPFEDPTLFLSMEDDRRVEVNPREVKESYLEEFNRFLDETRARCRKHDVDYHRVLTDEPLDAVLRKFLSGRLARRSGRR